MVASIALRVARTPAKIDAQVASIQPPQLPQPAFERGDTRLRFRVVVGHRHQLDDPPPAAALLRARRHKRSAGRRVQGMRAVRSNRAPCRANFIVSACVVAIWIKSIASTSFEGSEPSNTATTASTATVPSLFRNILRRRCSSVSKKSAERVPKCIEHTFAEAIAVVMRGRRRNPAFPLLL